MNNLLTARQQQILQLIVQLYGEYEEPIGSKTLLQQSYLEVSPATIRNDMLALERVGYLKKAHSSSGRIPSFDGYRYYIDHLIEEQAKIEMTPQDSDLIRSLFRGRDYDAMQHAQLAADILVSLTGYTAVVLGETNDVYHLADFKLIQLDDYRVVAIVLTDNGIVESELFELKYAMDKETTMKVMQSINEELQHLPLSEAQQRLKLTIPLLIQRIVGYQMDFSSVIGKLLRHLKANRYYISGKNNLFDSVEVADYKRLFNLVDGSEEMFQLLELKQDMLAVELALGDLANVNLVTSGYRYQSQSFVIGLIGPETMPYERILGLMQHITHELAHY